MNFRRFSLAAVLALVAGSAAAHPGHAEASLVAGFAHPFSGLDHALAMLAVGLFAARQRGVMRGALPFGFVLAMMLGAGIGAAGLAVPGVEGGVALSVLVLGVIVASAVALPRAVALGLIGLFAVFHGSAHYAEMGAGSLPGFVAGFVFATALLHAAGFLLANWLPETRRGRALHRAVGGVVAASGAILLGT